MFTVNSASHPPATVPIPASAYAPGLLVGGGGVNNDKKTFVTKQPKIKPFDPTQFKDGTPFDEPTLNDMKEVFALFEYVSASSLACLRAIPPAYVCATVIDCDQSIG